MTTNEAARAEAERLYPSSNWGALGFNDARSVGAFVAGAEWARQQAPTMTADTQGEVPMDNLTKFLVDALDSCIVDHQYASDDECSDACPKCAIQIVRDGLAQPTPSVSADWRPSTLAAAFNAHAAQAAPWHNPPLTLEPGAARLVLDVLREGKRP